MANYSTLANLEDACGGSAALTRIADPSNTSPRSAATTALITAARDDATALIDTYVNGTPGTSGGTAGDMWSGSTPAAATRAEVAIALYRVYLRAEVQDIPAWVVEDYERYVGTKDKPMDGILGQVAKGKVSWVASEPSALQNSGTVYYFNGTDADSIRSTNPRRTTRVSLDKL